MPWIDVTAPDGRIWQVNQDGLYLMARASARAELARRHTTEIRTGEGWFDGPVVTEVNTNWGRVNRETDRAALELYDTLAREVMNHPENSARNFAHIVAETRTNQNYLRELLQRTMHANSQSISRHVSNWENAVTVTRFIRDASWTTLIVLSAVPTAGSSTALGGSAMALSGGVRVSALAMGSVGRGQATYQDTGHVGAAMVNGVGSFVTGAIGLPPGPGAALSSSQQAIILGIQSTSAGTFSGLQSLVEGNSAETAAWQAVTAAGFNTAGGMMSGSQAVSNASLPIQLSVSVGTDMAGNIATSAIADGGSSSSPLPAPQTRGTLRHGGVPQQVSRDVQHVRETILRSR